MASEIGWPATKPGKSLRPGLSVWKGDPGEAIGVIACPGDTWAGPGGGELLPEQAATSAAANAEGRRLLRRCIGFSWARRRKVSRPLGAPMGGAIPSESRAGAKCGAGEICVKAENGT